MNREMMKVFNDDMDGQVTKDMFEAAGQEAMDEDQWNVFQVTLNLIKYSKFFIFLM